ncbi:sulfatase-like hydrolase/transferase [Pedobacter sp. KR3-3]|uniref:Sulfatase-like hydrolase/transferase n=1 Tax=Pedobacter albus TaxID=3113905 RepID=A0ABU7I9B9_9SPHI|nr:sulfatase-like hydrolase/transferase [Pedobacter sp. KR3-3]MEE1945804.1 sulfatase-like hydrolase/transferase [Pedobacter sp. KR3-3]
MKRTIPILLGLLAVFSAYPTYAQQKAKKPNIIFILTDDLGYGDVGVFFQNQRAKQNNKALPFALTPSLDQMAANGAILTQSYCAAPVCAPSRASILLGQSQGHANVRDNQFDKALANNHTLGTVLQKAGYKTVAIGKWGLQGTGKEWPAHPLKRGFDYFYGYMRHSDGHEHYPKEGIYRGQKEVWENRTEVSAALDKCYTGDLWTAKAKDWIIQQTRKNTDQPFFMYLAYDTPHAVLEQPTQGYPAGGGLNGGLKWLGKPGEMINTANGTPDSWTDPLYAQATYDDDKNPATPEKPWPDTYKRFATTTKRLDDEVGDLLKLLSDLKIDDNTLVIFSSDNGPSIEAYLPKPNVPYEANFFDSFGPFDGIKRDVLEGGMRMPVIAQWTKHIAPNTVVASPNISYDWMPTFVDAAGLSAPAVTDGVSLLPSLLQKGKQAPSLIYSEYFESGKTPNYSEYAPNNRGKLRNQMQMIRFGDIVGLRYNVKSANDDFQLFNVVSDTHQATDLAKDNAQLQAQMKAKVLQLRRSDAEAKRPYDEELVPATVLAAPKAGALLKAFSDKASWVPKTQGLSALSTTTTNEIAIKPVAKANVYEFSGYIKVASDGLYTFALNTNGKAFLRLHEAVMIDADYGYLANKPLKSSIRLKAGYHPFTLTVKDAKTIKLLWAEEGASAKAMGNSSLYH